MGMGYIFLFIVLHLFHTVCLEAQVIYEPNKFHYSRCTTTAKITTCEKLNVSKERREKVSVWPPGPFAIPMSIYGCPESQSRGWSRGVLKVAVRKPDNSSQDDANNVSMAEKYASPNSMKLQFCVKVRQNPELDTEIWIPGNYNIYMKGTACPLGFDEFNRTIFHSGYDTYGYLPNIVESEPGHPNKYINISMCERKYHVDLEKFYNLTFRMMNTTFMLEKNGDNDCPVLNWTSKEMLADDAETIYCLYVYNSSGIETEDGELLSNYTLSTGSFQNPGDDYIYDFGDLHSNFGDLHSNTFQNYYYQDYGYRFDYEYFFDYEFLFGHSYEEIYWYQLDLQRSLKISRIVIRNMNYVFPQVLKCLYDEVKWSFLHNEAPICKIEKNEYSSNFIHVWNVQGRFITFMMIRDRNMTFHFYIPNIDTLNGEVCNENLGMTDGSIQDFQISASSLLPLHPPPAARPSNSGWCHDDSDPTPWILVDLIAVTIVEGVSIRIWRRSEHENANTGWLSFNLYYGTSKNELQMYTDTKFKLDLSKARTEEQMFMFLKPVKARFIKLSLRKDQFRDDNCINFELQGCKLSGVPILNCRNSSEMFELSTEIRTQNKAVITNTSVESCNDLCRQRNDCSTVSVGSEGLCVQYLFSPLGIWVINHNINGYRAAKMCAEDPSELFPVIKYGARAKIINLQDVQKAAIITSIGYPFDIKIEHSYTWRIHYHEQRYVRLVFTNVSMNVESSKKDSLLIGTYLKSKDIGPTIDDRFNGRIFVIETNESLVFVTFTPCPGCFTSGKFRTIITDEGTPACMSIDSDTSWSKGRREVCTKPKMILTSMTILNLPYVNVKERFEILSDQHHSIRIQFVDFYIVCPKDPAEVCSVFTVIEPRHYERKYCNTDMPPKVIKSKESIVYIEFIKHEDSNKHNLMTEGFRLQYFTVNHSLKNKTEFVDSVPRDAIDIGNKKVAVGWSNSERVCSRTFKKCYDIFSAKSTWNVAGSVCRKNNQDLVTLHSRSESEYINYLLREQRFRDKKTKSDNKDESFRAHIGLRRFTDKNRRKRYIWMNEYQVTFYSWRNTQPSTGDCTRTYFMPFNTDNFWESEDCVFGIADYFICQTKMEEEQNKQIAVEDFCDTAVQKTTTNVHSTFSGKICQDWNKLTEEARKDFKERFPDSSLPVGASNYCADPSSFGIVWCYIEDLTKLWEPCVLQQESRISNYSSDVVFECSSNGSKIPIVNVCDKTFDCPDFTDELFCMDKIKEHSLTSGKTVNLSPQLPTRLEQGSYYLCGSKEWISILAKCDDVIDCLDASDEVNCSRDKEECEDNEFPCGDGNCVKLSQVCDLIPDCTEATDEFCEFLPCNFDEYSCDNKECIPIDQRCNNIQDCKDNSDETNCDYCKDSFHCDFDKCIPNAVLCDKYPDCDDGTDEYFCEPDDTPSSCSEWWEWGYHKSGQYVIRDAITVYCDFSSVATFGRVTSELRNIDVIIYAFRGQMYYQIGLPYSNWTNQCSLEVKRIFRFPYYVTSLIDDPEQKFAFTHCRCMTDTYKAGVQLYSRAELMSSRPCDETEGSKKSLLPSYYYRIYTRGYLFLSMKDIHLVELKAGPMSCWNEHIPNVAESRIECERDNRTLPFSKLCMYDVDVSGIMTGCRSGEHLQNCGNFSCPNHTIKCPGSYCIPVGFVCDGAVQCPGGQDELDCYCTDEHREVIFIVEDTLHQSDSKLAAVRLAEQFYRSGSIVRLLYYKNVPPPKDFPLTHRLLEIREEHVNHIEKVSSTCRYKSTARNLLPTLRLTKTEISGIVFIEDSIESSTVGELILSNLSKPLSMVYRIIRDFKSSLDKPDHYEFVTDIHISRWNSLFQTGYRHFPEICQDATQVPCIGGYRCSSSKQCIPLEQVCDGVIHCSNADDEKICNFTCPRKCKCIGQIVICRAADLNMTDINALSINTRKADFSDNSGIRNILAEDHLRFPFMLKLDISSCEIELFIGKAFYYINNLKSLDLSNNRIKQLPKNAFKTLHFLSHLNLDGNSELRVISSSAFQGLRNIRKLRISGTKLKIIKSNTFSNLKLQTLDISNNRIEEIEDNSFNNISVQKITFEGNNILKFRKRIFNGVTSLQELRTPAFKFCCIRPCYVKEENCYPSKNEFSSCGDLMRHQVLQAALWLVGIASLLGNLGSIIYRLVYDRERLKIGYGIFVTNLAVADFLMGIYLIMIAIVDSLYRERYIFMDEVWRNSTGCVMAGVLSTVSSEASVLFLCLITLDRFLVVKYPFGKIRFGPLKAYICCGVCWVFAIAVAVIPTIYTSYFQNSFYSRSGVCIALPLTRDKPPGWIYSVSIFVGLNFCTFILVALGQLTIFTELRSAASRVKQTQKSRKRDLQVARNLIFVATTDFLCWFPIGLMGILALTGHPISGDVYAWTAVFIMPFNSALNPILYTLSAIIGKRSFRPSIDEQNRTEFETEIGSAVLKASNSNRYVQLKRLNLPVDKLQSMEQVMKQDENWSISNVTEIAGILARYLSVLEESSVAVKQLSETNTYVTASRKKKHRNGIILDTEMSLDTDKRLLQGNVYQFGKLLEKMVANCKRKK